MNYTTYFEIGGHVIDVEVESRVFDRPISTELQSISKPPNMAIGAPNVLVRSKGAEQSTAFPPLPPSAAGTGLVAASYATAYLLIKTKHPTAVAIGGAILLIPDVAIFALGYHLANLE